MMQRGICNRNGSTTENCCHVDAAIVIKDRHLSSMAMVIKSRNIISRRVILQYLIFFFLFTNQHSVYPEMALILNILFAKLSPQEGPRPTLLFSVYLDSTGCHSLVVVTLIWGISFTECKSKTKPYVQHDTGKCV